MTSDDERLGARWAATLLLGALGGFIALALGLPLPWMLGGLAAVGGAAATKLTLFGGPVAFPPQPRAVCIPLIGVLIGGAMTPGVLEAAAGWWPGLLAVIPFVALCHAGNYALFRRVGGLSRPTAYFSAMPGGLLEAMDLGERHGADLRALTVLQFGRIAVTVTVLPLAFWWVSGEQVGSAAGATIGKGAALGPVDVLLLAAAGVGGHWAARRVGLPAGQIMGPMLASGLVHAAGLTAASPPVWMVSVAQLVIGVTLGLRFVGVSGAELRRCFALSALSVAYMLALGAALGLWLQSIGFAPLGVMLVALAPGGVVEMGLIALSLQASPIFVTAHHLVRIIATVWVGVWVWGRIARTDR